MCDYFKQCNNSTQKNSFFSIEFEILDKFIKKIAIVFKYFDYLIKKSSISALILNFKNKISFRSKCLQVIAVGRDSQLSYLEY